MRNNIHTKDPIRNLQEPVWRFSIKEPFKQCHASSRSKAINQPLKLLQETPHWQYNNQPNSNTQIHDTMLYMQIHKHVICVLLGQQVTLYYTWNKCKCIYVPSHLHLYNRLAFQWEKSEHVGKQRIEYSCVYMCMYLSL